VKLVNKGNELSMTGDWLLLLFCWQRQWRRLRSTEPPLTPISVRIAASSVVAGNLCDALNLHKWRYNTDNLMVFLTNVHSASG